MGRPKSSTRTLVEDAGVVDVADVGKMVGFADPLRANFVSLSVQSRTGVLSAPVIVRLLQTRPHLGACRFWFACPSCRRRCKKLYTTALRPLIACRQCHRLAYFLRHNKSRRAKFWHRLLHKGPQHQNR
jgi:hypothetical protein